MDSILAIFRISLVLSICSADSCFAIDNLGQTINVVFEICRPQHAIETNSTLGYQAIGNYGYGGGWLFPNKKSESNEPVYYSYAESEANHIAIVAKLSDSKISRYVFMRPNDSHLKLATWSRWLPPDFITDDIRVEGKILRKIDFKKAIPDSSSLLIRYKLMRMTEYFGTVRRTNLPLEIIEGGKCVEEI